MMNLQNTIGLNMYKRQIYFLKLKVSKWVITENKSYDPEKWIVDEGCFMTKDRAKIAAKLLYEDMTNPDKLDSRTVIKDAVIFDEVFFNCKPYAQICTEHIDGTWLGNYKIPRTSHLYTIDIDEIYLYE